MTSKTTTTHTATAQTTTAHTAPAQTTTAQTTTAQTTTLLVDGMTCDHCVRAVSTELGALDAVTGVSVDLRPGFPSTVTVTSSAPLDDADVRAAVDEAGYDLHDAAS